MANAVSRATLRTKTGCLTCRTRRKKCNEQRPRCERCLGSQRDCVWPTEADLIDRRHCSTTRSLKSTSKSADLGSALDQFQRQTKSVILKERRHISIGSKVSENSHIFNSQILTSDLDAACFTYLIYKFLPLVTVGDAPGFVAEMISMFNAFDGLKYVALACGASHLHSLNGNAQLHEAGLKYYLRAVRKVNCALDNIDWDNGEKADAVLYSVIFLYIHGSFIRSTNGDGEKHVTGAIKLMNLRYLQAKQPPIARLTHRIMWESIVYQMFRRAARNPFSTAFHIDISFCTLAEEVLQSPTDADESVTIESPVIGFPISLQRLLIDIVEACKSIVQEDAKVFVDLKCRIEIWEQSIPVIDEEDGLDTSSDDVRSRISLQEMSFCQVATTMHTLAASLLLDWAIQRRSQSPKTKFLPSNTYPPSGSWQLQKALAIMRCPQTNKKWFNCYLGAWPTLIFGCAAETREDVATIRQDLKRRWNSQLVAEDQLCFEEVDRIWRERGFAFEER